MFPISLVDPEVNCPVCGSKIEPIGCEKTTTCPECKLEWKWAWPEPTTGPSLVEVEKDDPIYWDR